MKLATWNVNSLGARLPRVLEFLAEHSPDVVMLQETKCDDAAFPAAELALAGYDAVHHGSGRWAGVAILARSGLGLGETVAGLPGELRAEEARWIEASVAGMRVASVYVTNGREVDSEWFAEKLAFLDAIAERVAAERGSPLVIAGDFNVAREDRDVYDPAAFLGATHVTAAERTRFERVLSDGALVDAYRLVHPDETQFTWWDYRQGHFHRDLGLRIDYILVCEPIARGLAECSIARDYRKGKKPSDHAPLMAEVGAVPE
jgi:exodeoxyribonuclease-3